MKVGDAVRHIDQTGQFDALSDDTADVVKHFCQVTACLSLDKDGCDEESNVERIHAVGHRFERILDFDAEVLLMIDLGKFGRDRRRHLFVDQLHRTSQ